MKLYKFTESKMIYNHQGFQDEYRGIYLYATVLGPLRTNKEFPLLEMS